MELGDNIIDSRDLAREIAELRAGFDGTPFGSDDCNADRVRTLIEETPEEWLEPLDTDDIEKLADLLSLDEQGEGCSDWRFGTTLILDEYFPEYARELAEDIGSVGRNAGWPVDCIDWSEAADALKMDYTSLEVGHYTYWVRS